jgi:CheY-like chemotaxis protein/HPt (histidine-containing phosphotransfer) domain-containing protein
MSIRVGPGSGGAAPRRGARVLLVDDDVLSQEVGCGMLEELGLDVRVAGDGAEAVRLAQAGGWDLVLMDMQMPVMDGLEATRIIRALPDCRSLPIIAMSANAFPEDRLRCLAAGMNDQVPKPVDPAQLRAVLAEWLPVAGAGQQLAAALRPEPDPVRRRDQETHVIDVEAGLRFFGGRTDAYHRMLQRFAQLRSGDAGLLRSALADGDLPQAGRIAHSLKSMAATLGATQLHGASAALEALLEQGGAVAVSDGTDALERALAAACRDIARISPVPAA